MSDYDQDTPPDIRADFMTTLKSAQNNAAKGFGKNTVNQYDKSSSVKKDRKKTPGPPPKQQQSQQDQYRKKYQNLLKQSNNKQKELDKAISNIKNIQDQKKRHMRSIQQLQNKIDQFQSKSQINYQYQLENYKTSLLLLQQQKQNIQIARISAINQKTQVKNDLFDLEQKYKLLQKQRDNLLVSGQPASQPAVSQPAVGQPAVSQPSNPPSKIQSTYVLGDFNTYAVKKQSQLKQLNQTINKIIKQAISSHLNQVQNILKFNQTAQTQSNRLQAQLLTYFPNKQHLAKFLQDPVNYFIQHKKFTTLRSYVQEFVRTLIKTYQISIIQNKITKLGDLKFAQYVKQEQNFIIPTSLSSNTFLKIGSGIQPTFMFQSGNNLKSRSQLSTLSDKQKKTIIAMVTSYLHDKNIIVSQSQLQLRIKQMISNKI